MLYIYKYFSIFTEVYYCFRCVIKIKEGEEEPMIKEQDGDRGAQFVWLSEIITWASEQSERGAKKHDLYFI